MSGHTPGPWAVTLVDETVVIDKHNRDIAHTYMSHGDSIDYEEHPEEIAANARLIAAAPEMLEALQAVWDDRWGAVKRPDDSMRHQIEAAIAKATGGAE